MKNRFPTAVLYGDLNMVRCFDGTGIPLCMVSTELNDLKFYSRYCRQKRVIADYSSEPEETLEDLVELGKGFSERAVLFYDDDQFQLFLSTNRERLKEYYHFFLPDHEILEEIIEKTRFTSLARRYSLPVPKTVCSDEVNTAEEVLQKLSLPCFFKPKNRVRWKESDIISERGGKPYKGVLAEDLAAFNDAYHKIKKFTNDFIIQEYIPGDDDSIYSFHAYFNRDSHPVAYFVGRKIRNFPREYGQSTYLRLIKEPDVVRLGIDILKRMNYVGLVKIDFKKDIRTNRFYILEINPRATLWNYLGAVSGVNLLLLAYRDLVGEKLDSPQDYRTDIRWLSFVADMKGFLQEYHRDGTLTWMAWISSYWSRKIYSVFSWRDPYPFAVFCGSTVKSVFRFLNKRLKQRFMK